MLGVVNTVEWTADSVDAPRRLTMGGTGMAGMECSFAFTLEPTGDMSPTFTVVGDFEGALSKNARGEAVEKDG